MQSRDKKVRLTECPCSDSNVRSKRTDDIVED